MMNNRITSYNVCYTKLLRTVFFATALLTLVLSSRARASEALAKARADELGHMAKINEYIIQHMRTGVLVVITSYSIHYTKLYEKARALGPGAIIAAAHEADAQPSQTQTRQPVDIRLPTAPFVAPKSLCILGAGIDEGGAHLIAHLEGVRTDGGAEPHQQ